jgi:hypothetical protein
MNNIPKYDLNMVNLFLRVKNEVQGKIPENEGVNSKNKHRSLLKL